MTQPRRVRVSDHALLRFLERAGGLDVEAMRASIGASLQRAFDASVEIGAAETVIVQADGLRYVLRHGVVITIIRTA